MTDGCVEWPIHPQLQNRFWPTSEDLLCGRVDSRPPDLTKHIDAARQLDDLVEKTLSSCDVQMLKCAGVAADDE